MGYPIPNGPLRNIHKSYFIQTEQVAFRHIFVSAYTYVKIATIHEKQVHEFEREKREAYGRV